MKNFRTFLEQLETLEKKNLSPGEYNALKKAEKAFGVFPSYIFSTKAIAPGWDFLSSLDKFDQTTFGGVSLKPGEELFRLVSEVGSVTDQFPLVKVNLGKMKIFYLDHSASEEGEVKFERPVSMTFIKKLV